jgi:hypothetical protein
LAVVLLDVTVFVAELLAAWELLTSEVTIGAAVPLTLGPKVAELETPFSEKHGPTCPEEELPPTALPYAENSGRFSGRKTKVNILCQYMQKEGGHTLSIFPNVGITLLACCVALLNLSVTEILLIKFSNK